MSTMLRRIKLSVVKPGAKPRRILFGPSRGVMRRIDLASQTQAYLGLAEAETHNALYKLTSGINSAIDIGAHTGEYLLYFLVKTSASTIIGFEPEARIIEELEANIALNGLSNDSRLKLYQKFVTATNSANTMTLDSINDVIEGPCFIKVDVDGGEADILRGATELSKRKDISWLIETHSRELEISCQQILTQAGYKVHIIPNSWWRVILPEQRPGEHNRWLSAVK
jgi:Methyltransferase FkbM domain